MLIAMTLIVIILAIVYQSFAAVVQSTEDTRRASLELRMRQFLGRSFTSNLAQATEGWSPGAASREDQETASASNAGALGRGTMRYWFEGESDSMSFATTAPMIGSTGLPGFVKLASYELSSESAENESLLDVMAESSMTLKVTETPMVFTGTGIGQGLGSMQSTREQIASTAESIGMETVTWNIPVDSMAIRYYDGENWVDSWDSDQSGRLPWAVDIRINFPVPPEEGFGVLRDPFENPDFRLIYTIPAGAGIHDEPPDYDVRVPRNRRERS